MKIEIYSDVLCPWCYIGQRRLAAALDGFEHRDELEIVWRSFELAPGQGSEPGPTAAEAMAEWTDPAALPGRIEMITSLGREEGLEINLHKSRPVGTFDAHRLTHFAAERGRLEEVMERLFHAYHTEARNIADRTVLVRLAGAAGLDEDEVRTVLEGDRYGDAVRADESRAREFNVTSVPSLVIDGRPPVSGVQDPEKLLTFIRRSWDRAQNRQTTATTG
ncbi:DsbA family oxidoreductase [Streptomyces sp. NPDC001339]|uniref:DsbA family oxidoreductase n=1 Tax=Streptomyces sp. NPDC001339 TaxID=3364563 RepID=UPI00368FB65D